MQTALYFSLAVYFIFYVFESIIRYGLNLAGADQLIFMRDIILATPLVFMFVQQFLQRKIHPAYTIYALIILLHGLVIMLNIGDFVVVLYGIKTLMTVLAGALTAAMLFKPSPKVVKFFFVLWIATFIGVMLDKYFVEFPWTGMRTSIGDLQVDISRNWEITGEDKRAGGFMRSSINVAMAEPLLALILLFNLRHTLLRVFIALTTLLVLYWSTQKGSIIAYTCVIATLFVGQVRLIPSMRALALFFLVLCIALPLLLMGHYIPYEEQAVFSFSSFAQRVNDMWPDAWNWIGRRQAFPFGVGLGGIGGAQRLYALDEVNYVDNLFILMYAWFGVMALVYLGWLGFRIMHVKRDGSRPAAHALATVAFLLGYGCVLSVVEDQIGSLFLGAAVAWVAFESRKQKVVA